MAVTLDGTWIPYQAELGGVRLDPDSLANMQLLIENENYTIKIGDLIDKGKLKFDKHSYPFTMDIIGIEGTNAGKTIHAIFARNINSLQVCYNLSGNEHPKDFTTQAESQLYFVKYQLQLLKNQFTS